MCAVSAEPAHPGPAEKGTGGQMPRSPAIYTVGARTGPAVSLLHTEFMTEWSYNRICSAIEKPGQAEKVYLTHSP